MLFLSPDGSSDDRLPREKVTEATQVAESLRPCEGRPQSQLTAKLSPTIKTTLTKMAKQQLCPMLHPYPCSITKQAGLSLSLVR